ncbi:hypothetical protein [Streptomyces sp. NPDC001919]
MDKRQCGFFVGEFEIEELTGFLLYVQGGDLATDFGGVDYSIGRENNLLGGMLNRLTLLDSPFSQVPHASFNTFLEGGEFTVNSPPN